MQAILQVLTSPSDIEKEVFSKAPYEAVPFLELTRIDDTKAINEVDSMRSPRMFKCHLPYSFLKKPISDRKVKVIVVLRNPKDTMVSYYHFHRMNSTLGTYSGTWEDFFEMFMAGKVGYGDWFEHTLKYWNLRKEQNVLIVSFEDMKVDPPRVVTQVGHFIGKEVSTEDAQKIAEMTSFGNMKKKMEHIYENITIMNAKISPFMRKGEVADWKNYFTVAQNEIFDKVYKEKMKDSGLEFRFE